MTSRPSRAVTGHALVAQNRNAQHSTPLELVITGERGTTEFARLSRLIDLAYQRLLAAKETA